MEAIAVLLNRLFDLIWSPLGQSPFYVDIIIISAISALIFLVIFKKTSNQEKIQHYKNKIFAYILEIRLYRDQPILTLRNILLILKNNLIYLRYTIVPMIAIIPILLIISVQINNRYGYSPLKIDNRFIIRADFDKTVISDIADSLERVQFNSSKGILIETPPIRIVSEATVFWRAKSISSNASKQFFKISMDKTDNILKKIIFTNDAKQRFSPKRTKWHLRCLFLDNAEDFIPETSSIELISINYPRATYPFLAWNVDPIILYFILTLILGLVFKPLVSVTF